MKAILPNKVYDVLKWVCLVCLPAVCVLVSTLGTVWSWGDTQQIVETIAAVEVFLGALLGVSCYQYSKQKEGEE